jgi:hypothetical protein
MGRTPYRKPLHDSARFIQEYKPIGKIVEIKYLGAPRARKSRVLYVLSNRSDCLIIKSTGSAGLYWQIPPNWEIHYITTLTGSPMSIFGCPGSPKKIFKTP